MYAEQMAERSEVLFIGGRAGVGKTRVALELHERLAAWRVKHAVIEGDNLDLAYPPVGEYGLAEKNLATMWGNFRALGYRKLIYTNTVSVVYSAGLADAMGDDPVVKGVLLRASDDNTAKRLERRETADDARALPWQKPFASGATRAANPGLGLAHKHRRQRRSGCGKRNP